jgi:sarcosine oxidase delta subunit
MKFDNCPFCGSEIDIEDSDNFHPSMVAWKTTEHGRAYVYFRDEHEGQCWEVHCCTHYGGCGASITADTKEETIAKWNKRSK